jgi:serine/threonine protein phosphatase PrpC
MQSFPHNQFDDEDGARGAIGTGLSGWARVGLTVGALIAGALLVRLGGGFPPQAWKEALAALTGQGIPPAHMDIVLIQAVVLLVAWLLLLLLAFQIVRPGRRAARWQEEDAAARQGQPTARAPVQESADLSQRQQWQLPTEEEMRLWQARQSPPVSPPGTPFFSQQAPEAEPPASRPSASTFGSIPFTRQSEVEREETHAPLAGPAREQELDERPAEQGESNLPTSPPPSHSEEQRVPAAVGLAQAASSPPVAQTEPPGEHSSPLTSSASSALERLAGMGSALPSLSSLTMETSRSASPGSALALDPTAVFQPDAAGWLRLEGWVCCHPGFSRRGSSALEDIVLAMTGVRSRQTPPAPFSLIILGDGINCYEDQQTTGRLVSLAVSEALLSVLWKPGRLDQEAIKTLLTDGIQYGNTVLHQKNQRHGGRKIATITVVLFLGTTAYIANVGDNRAYFYRESEGLVQITFDHSDIEPVLEQGKTTPEEIFAQAKETQVSRVLGSRPSVQVDVFALPLKGDDLLLLCSDGLWKLVRKARFQQIVEHFARPRALPELLGPALVQAALEAGGHDHISSVVVQARPLLPARTGEGGASR